ncbi:MAG: hypothetical protein V2I67_11525 [Thermoanaerobaculales bacterium]|nr:hypothetical protein [Thermoanaerobaculales bacterium]
MKRIRRGAAITIVFAVLTVAASRQLAMIVEVRPLKPMDGGTLTEVAVRVAPEDRGALGRDVMLWTELTKDGERVFRRGFALKVDDAAAPLRAEFVVPDGPHLLRVDVVGANSRSRGVWWGEVEGAFSDPDLDPVPDPNPVPESEAVAVTVAETVAETETETETETVAVAVSEPATAAAPGAASDSVAVVTTSPEPATATATATDADTVSETATEAATDSASEPGPDAAAVPAPELAPAPASDAVPAPEPAPAPARAAVPEPVSEAAPASADDIALVVAWDLRAEHAANAPWIARTAVALAREEGSDPPVILLVSHAGLEVLSGEPERVAGRVNDLGAAQAGPLSVLVGRAVAESADAEDGAPLLVVTDGLGPNAGTGWAEVRAAATQAGIPVLVAGIWSGVFPSGLRRDLRRLADATGGSVFYLQGPDQAAILVERFAPFVDKKSPPL